MAARSDQESHLARYRDDGTVRFIGALYDVATVEVTFLES
jgi:hypothetical protein